MIGIFAQGFQDHVIQTFWKPRSDLAGEAWNIVQNAPQDLHDVIAGERERTGQHLIANDGQCELIAAMVDQGGLSRRLLWRHIIGSAENIELSREPALGAGALADAE